MIRHSLLSATFAATVFTLAGCSLSAAGLGPADAAPVRDANEADANPPDAAAMDASPDAAVTCNPNPCRQGACSIENGRATCTCSAGYEGPLCETNTDDCREVMCQNGGRCVDGVATASCSCETGFSGPRCETRVSGCDDAPCAHGICEDRAGGSYYCACDAGWEGANCDSDIDECLVASSFDCRNGGGCVNTDGAYRCMCAPGFAGEHCETDIDECEGVSCNSGTCVDRPGSYVCDCSLGYTGTHCDLAPPSCQELHWRDPGLGTNIYTIDPDGTGPYSPLQVYCDMVTDGGGYTILKVEDGVSSSRFDQPNSCQSRGLQLLVPRTRAHLLALENLPNARDYFRAVPGVYASMAANYRTCAMNSNSNSLCSLRWRALDGGSWFLRGTTYTEPNGDYSAGCWLGTHSNPNSSQLVSQSINDLNCSYSTSARYFCSTNDKGFVPVTHDLQLHVTADSVMHEDVTGLATDWRDTDGRVGAPLTVATGTPIYSQGVVADRNALTLMSSGYRSSTINRPTQFTWFVVLSSVSGAFSLRHGDAHLDIADAIEGSSGTTTLSIPASPREQVMVLALRRSASELSLSSLGSPSSASQSGLPNATSETGEIRLGTSTGTAHIAEFLYFSAALSAQEVAQTMAALGVRYGFL